MSTNSTTAEEEVFQAARKPSPRSAQSAHYSSARNNTELAIDAHRQRIALSSNA
jgi:hypothetical protein